MGGRCAEIPEGEHVDSCPTRSRFWILAGLLAILVLPVEAAAQVQAGRIVGTVHDPSKAVLPNASIVVTEVATNLSMTVVTDEPAATW